MNSTQTLPVIPLIFEIQFKCAGSDWTPLPCYHRRYEEAEADVFVLKQFSGDNDYRILEYTLH